MIDFTVRGSILKSFTIEGIEILRDFLESQQLTDLGTWRSITKDDECLGKRQWNQKVKP